MTLFLAIVIPTQHTGIYLSKILILCHSLYWQKRQRFSFLYSPQKLPVTKAFPNSTNKLCSKEGIQITSESRLTLESCTHQPLHCVQCQWYCIHQSEIAPRSQSRFEMSNLISYAQQWVCPSTGIAPTLSLYIYPSNVLHHLQGKLSPRFNMCQQVCSCFGVKCQDKQRIMSSNINIAQQ